ncbi:MAG: hypothetical protein V6Z82_03385, partial [Flavobacteriales bacterium]
MVYIRRNLKLHTVLIQRQYRVQFILALLSLSVITGCSREDNSLLREQAGKIQSLIEKDEANWFQVFKEFSRIEDQDEQAIDQAKVLQKEAIMLESSFKTSIEKQGIQQESPKSYQNGQKVREAEEHLSDEQAVQKEVDQASQTMQKSQEESSQILQFFQKLQEAFSQILEESSQTLQNIHAALTVALQVLSDIQSVNQEMSRDLWDIKMALEYAMQASSDIQFPSKLNQASSELADSEAYIKKCRAELKDTKADLQRVQDVELNQAIKALGQLAKTKLEATSETKSETKPEATSETKPEATSETKSETKPEATSETKSETKPEATSGTKPEATSETKPET